MLFDANAPQTFGSARRRRHCRPPWLVNPAPIQPFEQCLKLGCAEPHDAVVDGRPAKLPVFQSLSDEHDAGAIPEEQLHPVGALRAEHVGAHRFAHQRRQSVGAFAEIDRLVATRTRTLPDGPITSSP